MFYRMQDYHQISIDLLQETEELFDESPDNENERRELLDSLGSLSYNISIILEVFNPDFDTEISDLRHLESLIEIRKGYIESFDFKKV